MTATVLLIRHAAHVELGKVLTGRRGNVSLSADGLEQAETVADLLGVEPLTGVYSSPRERAFYTARAIADQHEMKVELVDALDEIDFGDWTGRRFDELEGDPLWDSWNESRGTARPPGGEMMPDAIARAVTATAELADAHTDGCIAIVSHCDIIRGVVAHHLGLPLDNLLRFDIDPASVSRIAVGGWGARVISVNERLYR